MAPCPCNSGAGALSVVSDFEAKNPVHIRVNRSTLFLQPKGGLPLADREEGSVESNEAGVGGAELISADFSCLQLI